jgi:hypothetical protein
MKKGFLFLFLLLNSVGGFAQEKLFNEAIKRGITSNGAYCVENTKKKDVTLDEMKEYAISKGYIIGRASDEDRIRFGASKYIVDKMEFIDPKNYSNYVFHALSQSGFDFNRLKEKGDFYIPESEKVYEKKNSIISVWSGNRTNYKRCRNALWTGNVFNGLLDGNGVGFAAMPGGKYIKFEGTFLRGFPKSDINVKYVFKTDLKKSAFVDNNEIKSDKYPAFSRLSLAQNAETKDAELKKALEYAQEDIYKQDVAKIEEIYQNTKSVSISNYEKINQDHFVVDFITLYQTSNYDPSSVLPKVRELNDVFYVIDALKMQFAEHYYGYSLWSLLSLNYDWYNDKVKNHRDLLENGLNKAVDGKNSKYGFSNFFSQAADQLRKKQNELEDFLEKDYAEYKRKFEAKVADRKQTEEKYTQEIDWDSSKGPSGDLTSGLFDSYWYYENRGEIKFKGNIFKVQYNAFYNDRAGNEFSHFGIISAPDRIRQNMGSRYYHDFRNFKDMVSEIVKAM